ncbi:MAG: LCP family protein [Cyanobacteriota bacterium]|nr:LCP family protein [Cyanobacteriota bacterium]
MLNANNRAEALPSATPDQGTKPANSEPSDTENKMRAATRAVPPPEVIPSPTKSPSPVARWGRWKRRSLWSLAFTVAVGTSAVGGAAIALFAPLPQDLVSWFSGGELSATDKPQDGKKAWEFLLQYEIERPVNILVMGIDRVPDAPAGSQAAFDGRSDTMLLLRFDPTGKTLHVLSLPRDTQVTIPGEGTTKLNDANVLGGSELALEVVSETLNDIPIDRYVRVTNDAFRQLVDLVGGIEVDVPYAMDYTDVTQQLEIHLKPGRQILNGDQAEQFARFRMDRYGDIGRIQRQQTLLKALRSRLQSPAILPRLPKAARMMQQYVDTNLSWEEMLALVGFSLGLDRKEIKMVLLPGRFGNPSDFGGASYWLMSESDRDRILNDYFDQPLSDESGETEERARGTTRIAIANTTDDPLVARDVIEYLRERGFSNVYLSQDTVGPPLEQTEIVVQQGDTVAAEQLRMVLGMGRIEADSTGDLGSQLTLRVGKDWTIQN